MAFAALALILLHQAPAGLTLEQARALADSHAPDVATMAARAAVSAEDVAVAGIIANPKLTVGTTTSTSLVTSALSINLPVFGQRGLAIDAAEAARRVAALGIDVAKLDARLAVTTAWTDLWQLQNERDLAIEIAARRDRLRDTVKARFDEGGAPRLDVLRAETDAQRAQGEVAALEAQVHAAAARLALLLGHAVEAPTAVGEFPSSELLDVPKDALASHPILRRGLALVDASTAVVSREARARWPLIGFQVSGSFADRNPPPANDVAFALSFELPVFNGPLLERARAAETATKVETSALEQQLNAGLRSALAEYSAALTREDAQVTRVVPAAREAAELALEAYRAGGMDLTGELNVEQSLADARVLAIRATAARARARAILEHAAGRPL